MSRRIDYKNHWEQLMRAIVVSLILVTLVIPSIGDDREEPGWAISNTKEQVFHSAISNQDLRLFIRLPPGYSQSEESYSVVYYMDGHSYKGTTAEIVRLLENDKAIPKLLLVGIDGEVESSEERRQRRRMNLTPTSATTFGRSTSSTGGGKVFLKALLEEVIPYIDSTYRTKQGDRTLVGHSLGGLFALSTMLSQHSGTFIRYLSSSPSTAWDDRVIFRAEQTYAADNVDLPARLYMSMGSLENKIGNMPGYHLQEFAATLELRQYAGLRMKSEIREGETHRSIPPSAFSRGLRFLYAE